MLRGPIRPLTMLVLSATVLCLYAPATPCTSQARPNIVFVLTDDLDLNRAQFMPHVLAMERNGVSFANYFVTDSLCCPSRSSIFTGEFPRNSTREYHDRTSDPAKLKNTFWSQSPVIRQSLSAALAALRACQGWQGLLGIGTFPSMPTPK